MEFPDDSTAGTETPGLRYSSTLPSLSCTRAQTARTVPQSNRSVTLKDTPRRSSSERAAMTAITESPPRSTKPASGSTSQISRSSRQIAHTSSRTSRAGESRPESSAKARNFARSTFPLAIRGNSSRPRNLPGINCSGSRSASWRRSALSSSATLFGTQNAVSDCEPPRDVNITTQCRAPSSSTWVSTSPGSIRWPRSLI